MKTWSRRSNESGAMLVMAVVGVVVAMIAGALAIDLGRLAQTKRFDQKVADLAALDASRNVAAACSLAKASAQRNGFDPAQIACVDPAVNPSGDVVVGVLDPNTGRIGTPNAAGPAVWVRARSAFRTAFPFVTGPGGVNADAAAQLAAVPEAAFSVGSTLASLDTQASALDGVIGGMLGETAAGMSVVSYDGLATGNVTLAALRTKLVGLGYTFASPNDVLTQDIKVADLLTATSQVLADQGNTTAKTEIDKIIALTINTTLKAKLGKLVSLDTPTTDAALATSVNVFSLVNGSAQVANNGSTFVSVPGVNVTIPLVATVATSLSVIEPAQIARGKIGVKAKTSQVKLRLAVHLLASLIDLQIDFAAASGEAELTDISCDTDPSTIELTPRTSGAAVSLFANLGGLLGTLSANGTLAGTASPPVTFDYADEFAPPVGPSPAFSERVGVATLGFSPVANLDVVPSNPLLGAASALVVKLVLPAVFSGLNLLLTPVLQPVLRALGLDLAGADLMALGIFPPPPACGAPVGQPTLLK